MSLTVVCDGCRAELAEPGAIVLSPPDDLNYARKWHLCPSCWVRLCNVLGWPTSDRSAGATEGGK